MSRILLIGGGHAHVAVLADWAKRGLPAESATLLTPEPALRYSGMVPGWIAGEHGFAEGLVDLERLARAAGVRLVLDAAVAIDPAARSVLTLDNGVLDFDIASIDVGGVGRARRVLGEDPRILDVRPIARFVETIAERSLAGRRIAVVGGGAGGVELAFALRNARKADPCPEVTLVTGQRGLLPDLSPAVRRKVEREMARQHIALVPADARIEGDVLLAGELAVPTDHIVAALGSGAPDWPRMGGLAVDEAGFIAVDA
ncbi:MAG: FAD-dependent oxidoreductase, partial [Erythrobacter sp.]|nr:FAD-dependent oxidoreductase [Erythrobacter sp.]